jgi:hypothetical protein
MAGVFEALIRAELPKRARELYALAKQRQPEDCPDVPCWHRKPQSPTDTEWQHQLRRELHNLAVSDGTRNGVWRLKPR